MDFPIRCGACGTENWVDLEKPARSLTDKIFIKEEYPCGRCKKPILFFVMTHSLMDAMHRVEKMDPAKPSFRFHFLKTLKKAIGVQEKYHGQR